MAIKSSQCNFKISDFSHSTRGCLVSGLLPGRGRCSAAECCCRTPRSGQLQPCSAADTSPDIRGAGGGQTRHQWTCYHRLRLRRPQTAKRRSFQRQVRASSWPHNNEAQIVLKCSRKSWHLFNNIIATTFHYRLFSFQSSDTFWHVQMI